LEDKDVSDAVADRNMFKDRSAVVPETQQERELAPRSGGFHDGEGWQRYEGGLDTLLSQPAKNDGTSKGRWTGAGAVGLRDNPPHFT